MKRAEQFSETFVKKQADMFHEIVNAQNESFAKSLQAQIEEQRKWEAEIMKKEHDHQMQQMTMLMDGFLKGLQTIQQHQYLPSSHQTALFPESSSWFSQVPSYTLMRNPSPSSILSCNSNSSSQTSKICVPSASPSPSAISDSTASWSPPSQTSPATDKQTDE